MDYCIIVYDIYTLRRGRWTFKKDALLKFIWDLSVREPGRNWLWNLEKYNNKIECGLSRVARELLGFGKRFPDWSMLLIDSIKWLYYDDNMQVNTFIFIRWVKLQNSSLTQARLHCSQKIKDK